MNSRRKNSVKRIGNLVYLLLFIVVSCVPPTVEEYHEVNIDYKDEGLRRILDLQVRQDLDSLLLLMNDPNPTYRLFAAKSFASFQAPEAFDSLVKKLNDPFIEVKSAAAFALGQLGNSQASESLISTFVQQDSIDVNNAFNSAVLEAMGKVGSEDYLRAIASVSTYRNSDTLLLQGQVNAIYQYGLRDMFHPSVDKIMSKFLVENYPLSVKKMAAQYFYRFEEAKMDDTKFQLLKVMNEHRDPDIRMALATALTRKGYPDLQAEIFSFYSQEKDYRVKCNLLRHIGKYPYINVVERVLNELNNPNPKVGLCAAEYILNNGNAYDSPVYLDYINSDVNPFVRIKLYQGILRNSGRNSGSRRNATLALKGIYEDDGNNDYVRAEALKALSEDSRNYMYIIENYNESDAAILNTKAVESLVSIVNANQYVTIAMKKQIADFLKIAISGGDGGVIAAATEVFSDASLNFASNFDGFSFMDEALSKLVLPDELETYNALNIAIAKVKSLPEPEMKVSDNIKPIDWELFDQYSATPEIRIQTSKGEISIELYKNDAPQSVTNIIELIKTGYYNNKIFHRVIPNFVAQAGCPNGDGYGSLNYTIRSELNNVHYNDEGYIGYASAGLHTESTQWFITYSPTPHLNGKYTIFGKLIAGMDVLNEIEVGDKITRISISN